MQWFAVYTKPQKELWAKENIEQIGFEAFLPLIRAGTARTASTGNGRHNGKNGNNGKGSQNISKPLFPRYLFAQFDLTSDYWTPIRYARGVVRLISFGEGAFPASVPEEIIMELRNRQDNEGFVQLDKLPSDFLTEGDKVRVIKGPFSGLEGIFSEALKGEERVVVLLKLLRNRPVPTRLERSQIVKV